MSTNFRNAYPAYSKVVHVKPDEIEWGFLDIRNPASPGELACIYTGTIVKTITGFQPNEWNRTRLVVEINTGNGRRWTGNPDRGPGWTLFHSGVAMASLASVQNERSGPSGWALDLVRVDIEPREEPEAFGSSGRDEYLTLLGLIAAFDYDTKIHRISYQVTVLGREL